LWFPFSVPYRNRNRERVKHGGDQLQKLEETLGPLPQTWISSARTDGALPPTGLTLSKSRAIDVDHYTKDGIRHGCPRSVLRCDRIRGVNQAVDEPSNFDES
jgi:hypothetical protein